MKRVNVAVASLTVGTLVLTGWLPLHAKTSHRSKGVSDKTFMMKAAQGGMTEVQLGQMASEKGASNAVKEFGQRMVTDHSKANDQLKQVAAQKGVTLPTDIGAKNKALAARLSKLSGAAFDRAYVTAMVKDHKEDVAEFKKESTHGKDQDVKSFAAQTLPVITDHLKMVTMMKQNMSGRGANHAGTHSVNGMAGGGH
ncbi:MAG: DUF4142 domain-containing protein [Abitibacteriaceae bacterium]|nr:DUF4142 domain-containing protein [Abditibacteriaceae bacterium]